MIENKDLSTARATEVYYKKINTKFIISMSHQKKFDVSCYD